MYNPDVSSGDCYSNKLVQLDSTVSPPTEGWKTIQSAFQSSDDVPRFSLSNVINYFVIRTASDGKAADDFKSINKSAENLFHCGHVQALLVTSTGEYWWVKADCRPEMKKDKLYKMIMSLCKGSWDINSAICGCPAGKGPSASCKHIGALCYALVNFCSSGHLPDFITCTDLMQEWNKPCPKKHKPITVDELQSTRREILYQGSTTQPIPTMYDPRPPSMRTVEAIRLEQLRLNLLSVDHRCGILQQLIPSDKYLKHDHTYCSSVQVRSNSETPVSNAQIEVTDEEKLQIHFELTVSAERRLEIEFLTRRQAETPLWYSVRAKRITGSKCGKILCQHNRTDALLKSILYPTMLLNKPPPIQWGIYNEKIACNLYVQHMREHGHLNLSVKECGFIISPHEGWLGASPDGRVYDPSSDQPNGLLEVKCPYTKRAQTPLEACKDAEFYCTIENGKLKLKHNHAYYHQVQLQLYVSKDMFSWCDFCVYTTKGCLVTRISLDENWVKDNVPKLEAYFEECMLKEIICGRLKPSYYL